MIHPIVPFSVTLSEPRFQGHGVIMDVMDVLCIRSWRAICLR